MTFKKHFTKKNNTPPTGQGFRCAESHIYFCNMLSMSA